MSFYKSVLSLTHLKKKHQIKVTDYTDRSSSVFVNKCANQTNACGISCFPTLWTCIGFTGYVGDISALQGGKVRVSRLYATWASYGVDDKKHQPAVEATFTIPHEPASGPSQLGAEGTMRCGAGLWGCQASTCAETLPSDTKTRRSAAQKRR